MMIWRNESKGLADLDHNDVEASKAGKTIREWIVILTIVPVIQIQSVFMSISLPGVLLAAFSSKPVIVRMWK